MASAAASSPALDRPLLRLDLLGPAAASVADLDSILAAEEEEEETPPAAAAKASREGSATFDGIEA